MTNQENRSKYLSMLLRHKPEKANLTLDREGWCDILELTSNTDFTVEELEQIVADDSKQRYSISYWEMAPCGSDLKVVREPLKIRANQGHSTSKVKMTFKSAVPPPVLYHGADAERLHVILKDGLRPMNRHHVHLSDTLDVAEAVGGRRRRGYVVLEIDAKRALADGLKFFVSENQVWLIDYIPSKYLKVHE
jgi:putative RNA 2'-phosphotransferase